MTELGTNINTLICPACSQPKLLPGNPLRFGSVWRCICGHEVSEEAVKAIVENIINDTKDVIKKQKYDAWLKLENVSLKLVHPQHEVMLEIIKWLVPVLCRGPHQSLSDFPIS